MILAVIAVASVVGGIIQSTVAFGFGLVLMAILPRFIGSVVSSAALISASGLTSGIVIMIRSWRSTNVKDFLLLMPGFFLMMPIGTAIIMRISDNMAKILLGIFLIMYSLYNLFIKEVRIKTYTATALIAGGLSGIMSGMFALSSLPVAIYLMNATDRKEEYTATSRAVGLASGIYALSVRVYNDQFNNSMWIYAIIIMICMTIGAFIGEKIRKRIDMEHLRRWIYYFLIVTALTLRF